VFAIEEKAGNKLELARTYINIAGFTKPWMTRKVP